MKNTEPKTKAIAKINNRQRFGAFHTTGDEEKVISRYTIFIIGLVAFVAGCWAATCLIKAATSDGPLTLFKQLTSALFGR